MTTSQLYNTMNSKTAVKVVATNRKALAKYHILETYEAGISLAGYEVKSIRQGKVSLTEGIIKIEGNKTILYGVYIAPYEHTPVIWRRDATRAKTLLLHLEEIKKLTGKTQQKGLTLIPLEMYFKGSYAKIKIALVKGKRGPDRREEIKRRDLDRELRREYAGKHHL